MSSQDPCDPDGRILSQSCEFEKRQPRTFNEEDFFNITERLTKMMTEFADETGVDVVIGVGGLSGEIGKYYGLAVIRAHPQLVEPIVRRIVGSAHKLMHLSAVDQGKEN